jgi:hypothetical protein
LSRIHSRQIVEGLVQQQHFAVNRQTGAKPIVERDPQPSAGSLRRLVLARVIDQDAPHHLRGDAEEVGSVLPGNAVLSNEAQVGFMDESRRLQRVVAPFLT